MVFLHSFGLLVCLGGLVILIFVFLVVGVSVKSLVMVGDIHYGSLGSEFLWVLLCDFLLERYRFLGGNITNFGQFFLLWHAWLVTSILGLVLLDFFWFWHAWLVTSILGLGLLRLAFSTPLRLLLRLDKDPISNCRIGKPSGATMMDFGS